MWHFPDRTISIIPLINIISENWKQFTNQWTRWLPGSLLWKAGAPTWLSGKEPTWQCGRRRRLRFGPWIGKTPWWRRWLPTPGFLPGISHGQRSLAVYRPWSHEESDTMRGRAPLKEHLGISQRYDNSLLCTCLQRYSSSDAVHGSSCREHLWAQGILFLAYSSGGSASVLNRLCNPERSRFLRWF